MFTHAFRIVILFVAISLIGLALVPGLDVNLTPTYNPPVLSINYSLQGSPDVVERQATSPLENALSQIDGVNEIYSISRYNGGIIRLRFDKEEDLAFRKFETATIIRNLYKKLPEGMSYPRIRQSGGDEEDEDSYRPILTYSINGPYAPYKLANDAVDYIQKPLRQIAGVEDVEVSGGVPLQITIDFDPAKLMRYQLSKNDLIAALSTQSTSVYLGRTETASGEQFFAKLNGATPDIKALENTLVQEKKERSILLKDVARVFIEEQQPKRYQRINGQNAVYLSLYARKGTNKVLLAQQVNNLLNELSTALPEGLVLRLEKDETIFLKEELQKIYVRTALSVAILVCFIFLINRNWRYLTVLFSGIVVNLCMTSVLLYIWGIELHIYSIAGLTISFGLIVDNAIVMIDHLHKKANRKIFLALFAASLTTIMALLVVLLLPEEDRRNLTDFSMVVAVNLAVSLLVALFFSPALYQLLFKSKIKRRQFSVKSLKRKIRFFKVYAASIAWLVKYRKAFILLLILAFGLPIFQLPVQVEGQAWYNNSIGSDKYQDEIRPITDKILGGALRKFVQEVYEGYSYRSAERSRLMVNARLPFGTTLDDANFVISTVEAYLKRVEGIDKFVTNVTGRNARVEITFDEAYEDSALPYQLKARLQARSIDLTGVRWSIYGVGRGFSAGGESTDRPSFRINLKGYNYDELERQANVLADTLLNNRRVQEVKTNEQIGWGREKSSEYVLVFDTDRLAKAGVSRGQVVQTLSDLTIPTSPSLSANFQDELMPVYIKASSAERFSKYDLMRESLPIDTARLLKIEDYADLTFEETANEIHKQDRQYLRVIAFDYLGSARFGAKHRDRSIEVVSAQMPVGYSVEAAGYGFRFDKEKRQYSLLLVLLVGIYFISAILFENLRQPLYIISNVPISFIGLFLIFALFDFSFDQGGYAAFILLGGLVVNAAIFIVHDLNNSPVKKYNRAVIKSVVGKAQPILLTVLSTCFGLIPFLIEGEDEVFWFALAIGTIGGLLFSLFAVFVCLPVFLSKRKSPNQIA